MDLQSSTVPAFSYSAVDSDTATYLRQKELNIRNIAGRICDELGRELKEAQEHLAKNGYGCFEEWYTAIGLKKQSVYNYIHYHTLIVQQLDERNVIESLPKPLAYEVAKPTAPQDLKEKVLAGEITTTKEYQAEIKARKAAESRAAAAQAEAARLAEENAELRQANKDLAIPEKTVIEKVVEKRVEVVPPGVQEKIALLDKTEQEKKQLAEDNFNLRMKVMELDMTEKDRIVKARNSKKALDQEFDHLLGWVNRFLREASPFLVLADSFMNMEAKKAQEHETALNRLAEWVRKMREALPYGGEAIDIKGEMVDE